MSVPANRSAFGWYRPWLTGILSQSPGAAGYVSSKARLVAAVLATEERDGGVVTITAGRLGELSALNERTARRALEELSAHAYVSRQRKRNHLVITLRASRPITTEDRASHPNMIGRDARLDRAPGPPRSGVTPDSSTTAVPAPPVGPPQTGDDLPPRLVGNRRREVDSYQREIELWATRRYPGAEPREAARAVDAAVGQGSATPDAVDRFIAKWSPHIVDGHREATP